MTRPSRGRLRAAGLIALLTVLASPIAVTSPAAGAPDGSIALRGQPAWSTLGGDVPLRLGIRAAPGLALEVRAEVHAAVLSRTAFENTLDGGRLGARIAERSATVDALPLVGTDRVFTIGLQDPAAPRDDTRVRLSLPGSARAGVFPVKIELRDLGSGDVIDSFVTELVATRAPGPDEPPGDPLLVSWIWHIAARPSIAADGTPSPDFAAELAPAGRIGRLATALSGADDLPLTLVPEPETVEGLDQLAPAEPAAGVLATLQRAASSQPVLASTYVPVDGPALLDAGLGDAFSTELVTGRTTLASGLDAAVDPTVASTQSLDDATLGRLRTSGGSTRLIVDPRTLASAESADQFTPARPFRLDSGAGAFDAVEVNRTTSDLLVAPGVGPLRAQQLLAALTVVALEQPNRRRGVVIDTPLRWRIDPSRVAAILAGLRGHPLLEAAPVADLFDTVPAATVDDQPYARTLAPVNPPAAPISAPAYAAAERRIDALSSMVGPRDPLVADLRRQLLLTPASRLPDTGPSVSEGRLEAITVGVGLVAGAVSAPASRTVQLTARRAPIPVSIENASGRPVRVRISLESQKLEFPNGAQQTVDLAPGNTTTTFDVEARASGTFPVLMNMTSPDRLLDLQRARYTIRSSAVSGVGLFLTIGAALFLAAWWLLHWRRGRASRVAPT